MVEIFVEMFTWFLIFVKNVWVGLLIGYMLDFCDDVCYNERIGAIHRGKL